MDGLLKLILAHRYLYYVLSSPVLADHDYDRLEKSYVGDELPPIGSDLKEDYSNEIVQLAYHLKENENV